MRGVFSSLSLQRVISIPSYSTIVFLVSSFALQFGATIITTSASKLYTKKVNGVAVEKGVAFPVCISVNDVICNNSPLDSEELVSFLGVITFLCIAGGGMS